VASLGIGLVTPHTVNGNPEHLGIVTPEFRQDFVIQCQLISTHRAPVGGVEDQDDGMAAKVREPKLRVRSA
jgi:hypothetical protein